MKAELTRKNELLNDTKRKVATFEQSLKGLGSQIKQRSDTNNPGSQASVNDPANPNFTGTPNAPVTPAATNYQ